MLPRGARVDNVGIGLFSEHGNRGNKPPLPTRARAAEPAGSQSLLQKGPVLGMLHQGMVCVRGRNAFCPCLYHLIAPILGLF